MAAVTHSVTGFPLVLNQIRSVTAFTPIFDRWFYPAVFIRATSVNRRLSTLFWSGLAAFRLRNQNGIWNGFRTKIRRLLNELDGKTESMAILAPPQKVAKNLLKSCFYALTLLNMQKARHYLNRLKKASDCDSDWNISLRRKDLISKSESHPIFMCGL